MDSKKKALTWPGQGVYYDVSIFPNEYMFAYYTCKYTRWGLGRELGCEVFTVQAWGPEFGSPVPARENVG